MLNNTIRTLINKSGFVTIYIMIKLIYNFFSEKPNENRNKSVEDVNDGKSTYRCCRSGIAAGIGTIYIYIVFI